MLGILERNYFFSGFTVRFIANFCLFSIWYNVCAVIIVDFFLFRGPQPPGSNA